MSSNMNRSATIFILIDALGFQMLGQQKFLDGRLNCLNKTETVLGFSSSAIPTILTGKLPYEHLRWNLLFRSPETSPFSWLIPFGFLPRKILENRFARKLINKLSKRMCGAEGYFSSYGVPARHLHLFDVCEKKNIYKPDGILGNATIIDYMKQSGIPYRVYSYHDGSDEELLCALENDIVKSEASIFFSYLADLDAFFHLHCGEQENVSRKIAWYDEKISQVMATAEDLGKDVRFFIFSDHGMTPVTAHYDLVGDIQKAGIDLELDCMAAFDSTMARFWVEDGPTKTKICQVLDACPAGDVLSHDELQSLGVYFPDHRYGDIIFLMHPGTLIFPNWFGTYAPKGMHGFHPDDKHSYGVYMSNVTDYAPTSILDLYGVMKTEIDRMRKGTN